MHQPWFWIPVKKKKKIKLPKLLLPETVTVNHYLFLWRIFPAKGPPEMETAHIQSMICEWSVQPLVACAPRRSRFFSIMAILAWAMHFERFWNFVTPYCNCEQYVLFVWSSFGPFNVHVDGTEQHDSENTAHKHLRQHFIHARSHVSI